MVFKDNPVSAAISLIVIFLSVELLPFIIIEN